MFEAQAVVDWLVETRRADRDVLEPDLRRHALWHLGSRMKPEDLIRFATALICLRALDGDEPLLSADGPARDVVRRARRVDPSDLLLRSEIQALPDDADWLIEAVDGLIEAAWSCRSAFERLLAARNRLNVPALYREAVSPDLAGLVAALSGAADTAAAYGTVAVSDRWAEVGDLLTAVVAAVGEGGQLTISAATGTDSLTRLLRRRLSVWDLPMTDIGIQTRGRPPTDLDWQVLVTALPYRPQETRSRERQLRFLARLASAIGPSQTAVIVGPADLLADQMPPTQAGIRNEVLRSEAIEAIITLPGGLMPFRPGYQASLWVLRRDESGRGQGRVLQADVSDRPLNAAVVTDLVEDVTTWRREGYRPVAHRRAIVTAVHVAELLSGRVMHAGPRRPDLPEAGALQHSRVALLLDLQARLTQLRNEPPTPPLATGVAVRDEGGRPVATVDSLIKKGHLKRLKGVRLAAGHIVSDGHHWVMGIPELTGEAQPGQRSLDRIRLAEHYPGATFTEPGDVIIGLATNVMTLVDVDGFSVVEYPAAVLRVNVGDRTLTPRTLAALIVTTSIGRAPGAVRIRRLGQIAIPLLEPDETRALDVLLGEIDERRRRAREQVNLLDTLRRTAVTGIADGTLTITSNGQ